MSHFGEAYITWHKLKLSGRRLHFVSEKIQVIFDDNLNEIYTHLVQLTCVGKL